MGAHLKQGQELKSQCELRGELGPAVLPTQAAWANVGSIHCAFKLASKELCAASRNHKERIRPLVP